MPTFVHPLLLWGLAAAALPVLIHLINMLRHRRVPWAAMEFLLLSQRRNRTWILLKQLLLLLARIAAVVLLVMVVAQPILYNRLGDVLGGSRTHHLVLLDDSFSMSDRWADTSAFDEAKAVVERIGASAARQSQPQTFTLLRFSQAGRRALGTRPDFQQETVDRGFQERLRSKLNGLRPSETAAGPAAAMEAIEQLLGEAKGERRIVYLVTDFRARQWDEPTELRKDLAQLDKRGVQINLIQCVDAARPNLAIAELAAGTGTRAAGVPLYVDLAVQNFSTAPVKNVPVLVETDDLVLPAINIPEIPAGRTVKQRCQVVFPTAGQHQVTAKLETDAVAADNLRYSVLDFPAEVPALLVDGDPEALDARYLSTVLSPGGPVTTGIRPRIERPRYLSLNPLEPFLAVYLLNVDRLDESAIAALERYVSAGGGLAMFLGERSSGKFINEQLYRDGKGLFPLPVTAPTELLLDRLQTAPDLSVTAHPIFQIFAGERNSFLATVMVSRYFAVPKEWKPAADSGVQVIARLRNGAPFAAERKFGKGRVVAFLSTASPLWNNWARGNPSFVVAMLELQAYLSQRPTANNSRAVGSPLELRLDASRYQPQVRLVAPGEEAAPAGRTDAVPASDGTLRAVLPNTDRKGVYRVRLLRKDGSEEVHRYAFNVEAEEGDLRISSGSHLAAKLQGVSYRYWAASAFQEAKDESAGYNLSQFFLVLMIMLLLGEQLLAWSASYHPPAAQRGAAGGGLQ